MMQCVSVLAQALSVTVLGPQSDLECYKSEHREQPLAGGRVNTGCVELTCHSPLLQPNASSSKWEANI